ncbi:MAG: hypothetical protein ACLP8S_00330 [Solirubrobacteraceae bacterium]
MSAAAKNVTRKALEATAWQQGSLLPTAVVTPPVFWAHPTTQGAKSARTEISVARRHREEVTVPRVATRQLRQDERLVVISQTCDILKAPEQLPLVETALAITTNSQRVITDALDLGSARFRLLRHEAGARALVLDYAWRVFLDKGFLLEHAPDNSAVGDSEENRKTLARWLGRRYGRPVLSDVDVQQIADPVRERWTRLRQEEPDRARQYTQTFPEFRFRREPRGGLTLFILSTDEHPDQMLALEVAGLLAEALEPIHGAVTVDPAKRSYHTFTKADELSTEQLDLEWASYEEGEPAGLLPAA